MDTIPAVVFQCKHLEILTANNIRMTEVPKDIGKLIQLKTLNLSGCNITKLPDTFKQLTQLEVRIVTVKRSDSLSQ